MTACSRDYTVGYLYVTAARTALISAYAIDYQSGAVQQLSDSPIPSSSGQTNANPVALVASPNGLYLYVVNHDVSQVAQFDVGTDGKLYQQTSTNVVSNAGGSIVGSFPTAASIDPSGRFLFVTFTFQNGFTAARPGPGGVAVFPITSGTGALGAALVNPATQAPYFPVGFNPVSVYASPILNSTASGSTNPGGGFLYVVDQDRTGGVPQGILYVFSYSSTGALTALPVTASTPYTVASDAGTTAAPLLGFRAGTSPGAVALDPMGRYIYITDEATNQLVALRQSSTGVPTPLISSPFTTGQFPIGVTVDPRGEYVYVANFGSSTVSQFTIDVGDGVAFRRQRGGRGNGTDLCDHRAGPGQVSVHVEQPGQFGFGRAVGSA